jgi:protein ImuB
MTPKSFLLDNSRGDVSTEWERLENANKIAKDELWLAVYLPMLALEVLDKEAHSKPCVVTEEIGNKQFVHTASASVEKFKVVNGMSLSAAYILCPGLHRQRIDPFLQQQRLQQLTKWALTFSSRVSIYPPCSFVLEVEGSSRYFGGVENIQKKVAHALKSYWRHDCHLAISPTAAASLLLAKSNKQIIIDNQNELRSALGDLPIDLLPLNKKLRGQLNKTGVRNLRDLWRLPSATLSQRFGLAFTHYLDRVLGNTADLLSSYQAPKYFEQVHDIGHEIQDHKQLLPYTEILLQSLCDFLVKNDVYPNTFIFYFQHEQHIPTTIRIDLRQKLRDANHYALLLATKINQMTLVAPVIAIRLVAETLHAFTSETDSLFAEDNFVSDSGKSIDVLIEQLIARLGSEMITGLTPHDDHRPEYAYKENDSGSGKYEAINKPRPFWLLAQPKQLLKKKNQLYYKSLIHFSAGPERIETGWWDCHDIQRDYYIGIDEFAGCLWFFHDLKEKNKWYLHGLFG